MEGAIKDTLGILGGTLKTIRVNIRAINNLNRRVAALEDQEKIDNSISNTNLLEWISNLEKRVGDLENDTLLDD